MKKKERDSNFELMRIISMFLIVMWHLIFHGGLYDNTTGTAKMIIEALVLLGAVHVNSFVLLTGYFNSKSKFSLKKIISVFTTTWFYKALFVILAITIGGLSLSKLEIVKELLPIDVRDYWFINCYLVLYLISPFLNKLINAMSQKEYRNLLIVGLILFSIVPYITNQSTVANDGYTIINFCYLYFIGGYLRKYPIKENIHFKNFSKNKTQLIFLSMSLFFLFFNFLLFQFAHVLSDSSNNLLKDIGNTLTINYRSFSNPLVVIQTIFYFLYFSTLVIKSKFINKISHVIMDVYLIHENYYVYMVMYGYIGTWTWISTSTYKLIINIFLWTSIILVACIIIALIRKKLSSFITSRKFYQKSIKKIYNYIGSF